MARATGSEDWVSLARLPLASDSLAGTIWQDDPVVGFQPVGWDALRLAHLKPFKVTLAVFFSEGFCCFWLLRGGGWSLR